jgi:hypothetical protein
MTAPEVTAEQLEFHVPDPQQRRYWEHRGPGDWRPVTVRVRYCATRNLPDSPFPEVRTGGVAPRNVLVEREDGSMDVRPVRILRTKRPSVREAS